MPRTCNGELSLYALRDSCYLSSIQSIPPPELNQFPLLRTDQCGFDRDSCYPDYEPL